MTFQKQHTSLSKIIDEYNSDIFVDDDRIFRLKEVGGGGGDLDRAILIVYADEGSMAKAGKKFNVSAATIYSNIKRIRQVIKEKL